MYRFVVLLALAVASVLAIEKKCLKLAKPRAMHCCKVSPPRPTRHRSESLKECFEIFGNSSKHGAQPDCDLELCIGKVQGYVSDDETIDKNAMVAEYAEKFEDRPELVENIKNKCINADVKEYGPEGFCKLKKIARCIRVQYTMACPEFDDRGHCNKIKDLAEKCAVE